MAQAHSPGYLKLVQEAKSRVREFPIEEFLERLSGGERYIVLDIREESEWARGHLPGAHHLGRGILEREIERVIPEKDAAIVLYCDEGHRSVLATDNLETMGYVNVFSLDGGLNGWTARGLPTVKPEPGR